MFADSKIWRDEDVVSVLWDDSDRVIGFLNHVRVFHEMNFFVKTYYNFSYQKPIL